MKSEAWGTLHAEIAKQNTSASAPTADIMKQFLKGMLSEMKIEQTASTFTGKKKRGQILNLSSIVLFDRVHCSGCNEKRRELKNIKNFS